MTRHVVLDNVTHKDLKVSTSYLPGQGFEVNVARVLPIEYRALQAEYPLFLVKNTQTGYFEAIALLGFSDGENLYLSDQGWEARSIPLTIQRQPLLIGFQEQDQDGVPTQVPVVHIDLDHPAVGTSDGEPVFLPHGGESPWLEEKTSVLMAIHEGLQNAAEFSQLLVGLELVESLKLEIQLADGAKHTLEGLFTINEERLKALSGDALQALHEQDHLEHVYMLLASLPCLEHLIERKNRRLTG